MSNLHSYTGRFAPSPSGPLHFGSLLAALASYLDARAHHGRWLVRIEDIDAPRCVPGAADDILRTLDTYGLHWQGEVMYQSAQLPRYQAAVDELLASGLAYYCTCTRKMIKALGGVYPGTCRHRHHQGDAPSSIRIMLTEPVQQFDDRIQGTTRINAPHALEDTIIKRRDGLFAYNLVVVLDDHAQQVTHIVRGSDLLDTTATHLSLGRLLGHAPPRYAHIPVASVTPGRKLSKQNHAAALPKDSVTGTLLKAMQLLGLPIDNQLYYGTRDEVLSWAITHWDTKLVPKNGEIIVDSHESTYHSEP
ncbi:tRNA glutamyl-Q(34) synthetase GluQRS [Alteromonas salexigens]|uniref:tRNA glutamyl-Q(34) synthetase GluQRS n=1 Tax=Alteromonas salexigens TaxID=2982530 RepID=UPI0027E3B32B|nr:tRNA glutamyl-Q(34) synthetase GluQRS [Alteromonas salexigens]